MPVKPGADAFDDFARMAEIYDEAAFVLVNHARHSGGDVWPDRWPMIAM